MPAARLLFAWFKFQFSIPEEVETFLTALRAREELNIKWRERLGVGGDCERRAEREGGRSRQGTGWCLTHSWCLELS